MANVFSNIIPQILERSLPTLRENAVTPRLINIDIADASGRRGDTIDVGVPQPAIVRNVTPGQDGTNVNVTQTKVSVVLDQWRESPMMLTDKELEEVMEGLVPSQTQENLKALINDVDKFILGLAKSVYFNVGTGGTTPFATNINVYRDARKLLNNAGNLGGAGPAPLTDRRVLLDPDAEANALVNTVFLKADERGDQGGMLEGNIGRKLGADWLMNQNVKTFSNLVSPSHSTAVLTKVQYTAAATIVTMDRATLTGKLKKGALFTIADNSRQFVVTATVTAASNAIAVTVEPAFGATVVSGKAITFVSPNKLSEVANLMFHRDWCAFASRPLGRSTSFGTAGGFSTIVDPISGLVVRLEISRQNKQWTLDWDILYGATAVRPELCVRILG